MDLWQVLGFVSTINTKSVLLTYAASFYLDLTHAVSTAIFLLLVAKPWTKILNRVKIKYGLDENNSN
jgi:energy-coupling factor transport system substrate-specific component